MTSALPDGVHSDKENRSHRTDSVPNAPGSSLRDGNGSRRSSASSAQQSDRDDNTQKKTPYGQAAVSGRSGSNSPSLSLTSSGNGDTVTCTVVEDGQRHVLQLNRAVLTPVMERLSEDTMSTAKKSKTCASPPLQGENVPLGSIRESSPPDSSGGKSAAVSSPLASRTTSPRKSIDRPSTPIPLHGVMSPTLSVLSGRSGRSFHHKVPVVPVSGALPSPVRELVQDGQVLVEPASTSTGKTYQGQEPFVPAEPPKTTHSLSSGVLDQAPEARSTTPQVMVEGWLDDVGPPTRLRPASVHDHGFRQDTAPTEKTSNESIITNATLTPPAFTPIRDEVREQSARAIIKQDSATEAARDQEEAKPAGQPATALAALGTTIADALKSLMPAAAAPATNIPEHNVPIPHDPATAPSPGPATRTSDETVVPTEPETIPDTAADPAPHAIDPDNSSRKRRVSASKIPGLSSASPAVPTPAPAAPAVRVPTGFPFTSPSTVAAAASPAPPGTYPPTAAPAAVPDAGPATPAPPGRYPADPTALTPRTRSGDASPFGPGTAADKSPFVSFRAKQLLGHFLARDATKQGVDRVAAQSARGGGHSLCDADRALAGRGGFEAGDRRGGGRGRGGRKGVQGTE